MTLVRSTLRWPQIAGLGISLVIAGQFTGWNYGLRAGWANLVAATVLMAILCFGLALCVAELSASRPHAGGLYAHCQDAFGRWVGYLVGVAIFAALAIGTGAATTFISAYGTHVLGFGGPWFKVGLCVAIAGVHLRGVGEAMRWLVGAGILSLSCIALFLVGMAPHYSPEHLATSAMPLTITPLGVFTCVPFAIWLFISIEQTAAASEEAENPGYSMPRGMMVAMATLLASAVGILLLAVGGGGVDHVAAADDPLFAALSSPLLGGASPWLATVVGLGGMLGLIATMFSLIYSASRQLYAIARDGHLPPVISRTNARGAPDVAILLVACIAILTSFVRPERVLLCVVLLLAASYVVLLAAFIRQRQREPHRPRPFRAWGGRGTAAVCMLLSLLVLVACFQSDVVALAALGSFFMAAILIRVLNRGAYSDHPRTEGNLADV